MNTSYIKRITPLILVADDDKLIRQQICRKMQQQGYQVAEVDNGEQCLDAYNRLRPDIILLDAVMPIMDGFTCCTRLQTLSGGNRIPVLMLMSEDRVLVERSIKSGATDYVPKPIHWLVLFQRVGHFLHSSRAIAELELANKELETFSYSVSHELRAPLRRIRDFSRLLVKNYGDQLNTQGKHFLHRALEATQEMSELIEDLLTLSEITHSNIKGETVDLSRLALFIASDLQQRQPDRQVEFVSAQGLTTNGDRRLLQIVLENLLGNAWKFTGKVSQAKIEVGAIQNEGQIVYFVRDNGVGFDTSKSERLFCPFERLHSKTEFPGTGIGLAIVQRIIHRHGGQVWAEGVVEQGATFYFTL